MQSTHTLRSLSCRQTHHARDRARSGQEFQRMIKAFRASGQVAKQAARQSAARVSPSDARLRVCVRKRPILSAEEGMGEFDVLTCCGRAAVLHQTRKKVDLEKQLENHTFLFDELFDDHEDNAAVYARGAPPDVERRRRRDVPHRCAVSCAESWCTERHQLESRSWQPRSRSLRPS